MNIDLTIKSTDIVIILATLIGISGAQFALAAEPIAVIIYDQAGKGDKSFNDSASVGIVKAQKELGVTIREVEPRDQKSYLQFMESFANKKIPLIIGIGFTQADAIKAAAKKYPKTHFAIVDAVVDAPNVTSLVFKEQEGSYLAGYVAAKTSKTGKIGFVGGMEIPLIKRFFAGYAQGAKSANDKITIFENYVGTTPEAWSNPGKGKEIARSQYDKGADVIYHAAGGSGMGVFDAASETKKFAIGVDSNQNHIRPGHIITSMLKRVDTAVFDVVKAEKAGSFKAGKQEFGVANNGVDLAFDSYSEKFIDKKMQEEIANVKQQIASGKIVVNAGGGSK